MELGYKTCFKCGVDKPLSDYYKHKQMGDGHLNKCKACTKADTKKREGILREDSDWVEKEQKRHREKYYRLGYKEKHKTTTKKAREALIKYRKKYPEKYKATSNLRRKVKPKIKGNHLHHWSYNEEHYLDVIELNVTDHAKLHRFLIYDQSQKMYKTKEGIILDTKQEHENYINEVI